MVPLVASPVYGFLYRSTIETYPSAFLLFTAALYVIVGILLIIIHFGLKKLEKRKITQSQLSQPHDKKEEETLKMIPSALQPFKDSATTDVDIKFA